MSTRRVNAHVFASFAVADLVRWRALVGSSVTARDPRWGGGRVVDARWEGRSDRPDDEGRVYVRVEYADGLRARVDARAFARHHVDVEVREDLAEFLARWSSEDRGAAEAELAAIDEALRREQDAQREKRARELRDRARPRSG